MYTSAEKTQKMLHNAAFYICFRVEQTTTKTQWDTPSTVHYVWWSVVLSTSNPESEPHSVPMQQTDHFTSKVLEKHQPFHLKGRTAFWKWNLRVLHSAAMRTEFWLLSKSWCSEILIWIRELKLQEKNQKFVLLIHTNMWGARSVPVFPEF